MLVQFINCSITAKTNYRQALKEENYIITEDVNSRGQKGRETIQRT
jgi:hypothetical protein